MVEKNDGPFQLFPMFSLICHTAFVIMTLERKTFCKWVKQVIGHVFLHYQGWTSTLTNEDLGHCI